MRGGAVERRALLGVELLEALGEVGVLRRAQLAPAARAPSGVTDKQRGAPVGRVGGARDEPRLLEPGDDARGRRALDALARRRARSGSADRGGRSSPAPRSARG